METMFLIFGSAFVVSALAWYFTWAIFVHATASGYGTGPDSMDTPMPPQEKERLEIARSWARRLRLMTLTLLVLTAIAAGFVLYSRE